jgi:prepilin-type processing-associated H-X9-DG protein
VIAVIVILISLLFPALGKARDAGRRISCLGNQRQLTLGVNFYEADFMVYPPCYMDSTICPGGTEWSLLIIPYLKANGVCGNYGNAVRPDIVQCPSAPFQSKSAPNLSYGVSSGIMVSLPGSQAVYSQKEIKRPSEIVLLSDSCQINGGSCKTSLAQPCWSRSYWASWTSADKDRAVDADWAIHNEDEPSGESGNAFWVRWRHSNSANMGFADGHVKAMKMFTLTAGNVCAAF